MIRRGLLSKLLICFCLLWIGHVHTQNQKIIRVGLFSVPPHIFPSNPPTGSSIEFIKKFAKDNNYQIEWLTELLDSINDWIKKNPYQPFIEDSLKK